MSSTVGLLATVALLLANGFFVAAEFALVSARRASIEPQAERGSRRAVTTLRAMERVSDMLAGAQLGITLCSLALGALSEPAIAHLLEGPFAAVGIPHSAVHPAAFTVALLLVTLLHVVVGEMVPKNLALAAPERSSLWLSPVLAGIVRAAHPVIWVFNGLANLALRAVGVQPRDEVASTFTRDEVAALVEESHRSGLLQRADRDRIGGALAWEAARVRDVTVPLAAVHSLPSRPTPEAVEALAARTGVTRFPLRSGDRSGGSFTGYVHLKDVLAIADERRAHPIPEASVRVLPELDADLPLGAAVEVMRAAHVHLARVTGAGRTLGVLTLDDVLIRLVRPRGPDVSDGPAAG